MQAVANYNYNYYQDRKMRRLIAQQSNERRLGQNSLEKHVHFNFETETETQLG